MLVEVYMEEEGAVAGLGLRMGWDILCFIFCDLIYVSQCLVSTSALFGFLVLMTKASVVYLDNADKYLSISISINFA